jgi:Rieske 2Fe-2S family protein
MKFIATDVTDSAARLAEMVTRQQGKPGFAIDSYFYRSHVTYQTELEQIVYKSWIYAGHISQIPNHGDYFLFELGEDSIIVSRDDIGKVQVMHNICRHRG